MLGFVWYLIGVSGLDNWLYRTRHCSADKTVKAYVFQCSAMCVTFNSHYCIAVTCDGTIILPHTTAMCDNACNEGQCHSF